MDNGQHATERKPGIVRSFIGIVAMVVVVIAAAWGLRTFVLEPFESPSASMEHTIDTGDRVFAEKLTYLSHSPQPGDIVVFDDPQIPSRTLIKRVVATEGQTVDLRDGAVYVDDVKLDEPYTEGAESLPLIPAGNVSLQYPYTVPAGTVWVMGDNRENSADSRYFGAVPVSNVTARAFMTYWPLNRIGLLDS